VLSQKNVSLQAHPVGAQLKKRIACAQQRFTGGSGGTCSESWSHYEKMGIETSGIALIMDPTTLSIFGFDPA